MAETYLLEKLQSVEQTFTELTRQLADPDVTNNPEELQRVAKARASLEATVDTYELWKKTQASFKMPARSSKSLTPTPK